MWVVVTVMIVLVLLAAVVIRSRFEAYLAVAAGRVVQVSVIVAHSLRFD